MVLRQSAGGVVGFHVRPSPEPFGFRRPYRGAVEHPAERKSRLSAKAQSEKDKSLRQR